MNENNTIRIQRRNYTQVSNTAIFDKSLSIQAKGLYSIINALFDLKTYKGEPLYKADIQYHTGMSENTFDKYWKELKEHGYLKQEEYRNKGQWAYTYKLFDTPQEDEETAPQILGSHKLGSIINTKNINNKSNTNITNTANTKKIVNEKTFTKKNIKYKEEEINYQEQARKVNPEYTQERKAKLLARKEIK